MPIKPGFHSNTKLSNS